MVVNNEVGIIYFIEKIVAIVKCYVVFFFCDVFQVVGKILINFQDWDIILLVLFGYKFYVF